MERARNGDTVRVHYTGMLPDGSVFDSSSGRDPIEFTVGAGQVIPGFDDAVTGMEIGEEKAVRIPAESAYGPRKDELMLEVERTQFPPHVEPAVGQQFKLGQGDQTFVVTIKDVRDDRVVLDANHPLAGQELTFELELVEIR
jgi:peptidylprolyl isomerase